MLLFITNQVNSDGGWFVLVCEGDFGLGQSPEKVFELCIDFFVIAIGDQDGRAVVAEQFFGRVGFVEPVEELFFIFLKKVGIWVDFTEGRAKDLASGRGHQHAEE